LKVHGKLNGRSVHTFCTAAAFIGKTDYLVDPAAAILINFMFCHSLLLLLTRERGQ